MSVSVGVQLKGGKGKKGGAVEGLSREQELPRR
jgi:hypothetical protein